MIASNDVVMSPPDESPFLASRIATVSGIRLPFSDGVFDDVVASLALHYLKD
jgi:hypothetical protein